MQDVTSRAVANYKPIDYSRWDTSGTGKNILPLMNSLEATIWNAALQYQDKRDDAGHSEVVTYFAFKLLEFFPDAKREVVVPAAILHDMGWSQMSEEELAQFYLPNWKKYEPDLRLRHQVEGVYKAAQLLDDVDYLLEHRLPILDILLQHDTRKGFASVDDGVVRDADKLWRYTLPHLPILLDKRGLSLNAAYESSLEKLSKEGFFFSQISHRIARIELNNAVATYTQSKSHKIK